MKKLVIDQYDDHQRIDKYLKKVLVQAPSSLIYKMLRKKEARIISLKVDLLRHDIIYTLSIASNLRIKCHKGNFEEISDLIFDSNKATSPN